MSANETIRAHAARPQGRTVHGRSSVGPIALSLAVALCVGSPLSPSRALAQEPSAAAPGASASQPAVSGSQAELSAEQLFELANQAYHVGNRVEAEALYRKAWEKRRTYDIAANLARVLMDGGSHAEAAELLAQSLAELPPSIRDDIKKALEAALATASAESTELVIRVNVAGADVRIDDRDVGRSPLAKRLFVMPGSHTVSASKKGHEPASLSVEGKRGARAEVALELAGAGDPALPVVAGVGFGLAGAGAVVTVVLAVLASGKKDDLGVLSSDMQARGLRCREGSTEPTCVDARDTADAHDSLAPAAIGVGIATGALLAVTGGYLAWSLSSTPTDGAPAESAQLVPFASPSTAGLAIRGTFFP
jgi:hypothetical protein